MGAFVRVVKFAIIQTAVLENKLNFLRNRQRRNYYKLKKGGTMRAKIVSLNISLKKGEVKTPVQKVMFKADHGIEGDAHAGEWHRQVSLLAIESIDKIRGMGIELTNGIFAENITTEGIELNSLPIGTKLKIGESVQEVTQIGKTCHNDGCAIKAKVGECVMPREGIFTKVLKGGEAYIGDPIEIIGKAEI